MKSVKEKVSYLRGLTNGLEVDRKSPEGKLLVNIIDVLDSFAEELDDIALNQQDIEDYVETIDEDLTDLEEEVYGDEELDEDIDQDLVEVECPTCHESVHFEASALEDDDVMEVSCPKCGDAVYENMYHIDHDDDYHRRHMDPGL